MISKKFQTQNFNQYLLQFKQQLKSIRFSRITKSVNEISEGNPFVFLAIIHYALFGYSQKIQNFLSKKGYKPDYMTCHELMEMVYCILEQEFNYRIKIYFDKFFSFGYVEQKMKLCIDVIEIVKQKNQLLNKEFLKKHQKHQLCAQQYTEDLFISKYSLYQLFLDYAQTAHSKPHYPFEQKLQMNIYNEKQVDQEKENQDWIQNKRCNSSSDLHKQIPICQQKCQEHQQNEQLQLVIKNFKRLPIYAEKQKVEKSQENIKVKDYSIKQNNQKEIIKAEVQAPSNSEVFQNLYQINRNLINIQSKLANFELKTQSRLNQVSNRIQQIEKQKYQSRENTEFPISSVPKSEIV